VADIQNYQFRFYQFHNILKLQLKAEVFLHMLKQVKFQFAAVAAAATLRMLIIIIYIQRDLNLQAQQIDRILKRVKH